MAQRPLERDFADYLVAQTASAPFAYPLVLDENLYLGRTHMASTPVAVFIIPMGSGKSDEFLPLRDDELEIIVRDRDYEAGHNYIENILQVLTRTTFVELVVGGKFAMFIMASSGILYMGKDANGLQEFAIHFAIRIRENT